MSAKSEIKSLRLRERFNNAWRRHTATNAALVTKDEAWIIFRDASEPRSSAGRKRRIEDAEAECDAR